MTAKKSVKQSERPKAAPGFVVHEDIKGVLEYRLWVAPSWVRMASAAELAEAAEVGPVLAAFNSRALVDLLLDVAARPVEDEENAFSFKEEGLDGTLYRSKSAPNFLMCKTEHGFVYRFAGKAIGEIRDHDLGWSFFGHLRPKHQEDAFAGIRDAEDRDHAAWIAEQCARNDYSLLAFEGICEAVSRALEDGVEVKDVIDPDELCSDSALSSAAWLVRRSDRRNRTDGPAMVSALLVELGVPHPADAHG